MTSPALMTGVALARQPGLPDETDTILHLVPDRTIKTPAPLAASTRYIYYQPER